MYFSTRKSVNVSDRRLSGTEFMRRICLFFKWFQHFDRRECIQHSSCKLKRWPFSYQHAFVSIRNSVQPWQCMLHSFWWAFITAEPWISVREAPGPGNWVLNTGTMALCCYFLSPCSCHVLLVETDRSNSCSNCSLTGRRCWESQTETTLSLLHCTTFPSPSCSLPPLFLFSLTWAHLKWQVSEGLLSHWIKTLTLVKSQHVLQSLRHLCTILQSSQKKHGIFCLHESLKFKGKWRC